MTVIRRMAARWRSPTVSRPVAPAAAFAKLASHMDIGWDLDGTLIGHEASPLLHGFIRDTPRIRHVLITFRTPSRAQSGWNELASYAGAPTLKSFAEVVFLDEDAMEGVARLERAVRSGWVRPGADLVQHMEWKGRVCRRHDLTALVDDKPRLVEAGCRRFGIDLFHPQDFVAATRRVAQ